MLSRSQAAVEDDDGVRLNKCIPSLSRRGADLAIRDGRVTLNGTLWRDPGYRCRRGDVVCCDGIVQPWTTFDDARRSSTDFFLYLKYWKPQGVICTRDSLLFDLDQRVFPVGRLDKDTTGLLLLTSDGRVPEKLLRPAMKQPKVYEVHLDRPPTDDQLDALRTGVVITTVTPRATGRRSLTASTRPCKVDRISRNVIRMTLREGRNRQIRRMCDALDLTVKHLHRISFAGIDLSGLQRPGDWLPLRDQELNLLRPHLLLSDD